MNSRPPARAPQNWVGYAGLVVAVAGIVYQGGMLSAKVTQNTDRITKLEASDTAKQQSINEMNMRGARNEAKLDYLVEKAR